jgi:hypothetical protein
MSNAQLEAAQKLAAITGRPITDFFKMPSPKHVERVDLCECGMPWNSDGVCNGPHEENKQREEETVEERPVVIKAQAEIHTGKTGSNKEERISEELCGDEDPFTRTLLDSYSGTLVNGRILHNRRQMTRKEYLDMKKKFKSVDEFWKSPALYLMFRSEGQTEANFMHWTTVIEKEIEKRCK